MLDFLRISETRLKNGDIELSPKFIIKKTEDLMIRGSDFYAIWNESTKLWSMEEQDVVNMIDRELRVKQQEVEKRGERVVVKWMWDSDSGRINAFHTYCQKQMRDCFHPLDRKIIFSNQDTTKEDFATFKLPYAIEDGTIDNYKSIFSVIYDESNLFGLEWVIGAIITGASKDIQKFAALTGDRGTGKSSWIGLVEMMFDGYWKPYDAKVLGSSSSAFPMEALSSNPLIAIQHDGDLSKIDDNTRLNSLISHETITVNEKYKTSYPQRFDTFLIMASNEPVKITSSRSGLLRRLIDFKPTGNLIKPKSKFDRLYSNMKFELGAIAYHCKQVYESNPSAFDSYVPLDMMEETNDFYNFMLARYFDFKNDDGTSGSAAWAMYKEYCEDTNTFKVSYTKFKAELKNYFEEVIDRYELPDGTRVRGYYKGFRSDRFERHKESKKDISQPEEVDWLLMSEQHSILDDFCQHCDAQYADENNGIPSMSWSKVNTKLSDIDSRRLHYVRVPINHIVIDFDIPDEDGNKCLERNLEAAREWPKTYAELSKSGKGVHLHYIYTGDPLKLSPLVKPHVEIKVYKGKSSLRRKLTLCNAVAIATISANLPLRKEKKQKMLNDDIWLSESTLRDKIAFIISKENRLKKEPHGATKPNVDFIRWLLDNAYESGTIYDLTDMRAAVSVYAAGSNHQAQAALKTVGLMHFKSSDDIERPKEEPAEMGLPIVFYDVEVFPNLFLLNWKYQGPNEPVHRLINPGKDIIAAFVKSNRLIGFNCRKYDNHILYGRMAGLDNWGLYLLSKSIIKGQKDCFYREAYNISYTDVYDFSSKKQSLKKFEIELKIRHVELGLDWDLPVPEELWEKVSEYCDNDVIATEAVFNARESDWVARQILADISGLTPNDTTNACSTRFIFGNNKKPQKDFCWRDMGDCSHAITMDEYFKVLDMPIPDILKNCDREYTLFDSISLKPVFKDYICKNGISSYRQVKRVGEGGRVQAKTGMYGLVALLDIASMHPTTIIVEMLFGYFYTGRFEEIVQARLAIKHGEIDKARTLLDGKLEKYLNDEKSIAYLADALKIVINSVYGLTKAGFANPFKDPKNYDNLVAKRGALFMINLEHEVSRMGYEVIHTKTDSVKIPNATPEIIEFVMEYGKMYGYNFEHEATYEKMCLVNDAVYVAKYATGERCKSLYGYIPDKNKKADKKGEYWTHTGKQFAVPYVFKTLFTHEEIDKDDLCETKEVATSLYLDFNENLLRKLSKESGLDEYSEDWINDISFTDRVKKKRKTFEFNDDDYHDRHFIGRVGSFCPVKPGTGGGLLVRVNNQTSSFAAATGSKGYRWEEAWRIDDLDKIDKRYFDGQVQEAIDSINEFGPFDWFVSEENYSAEVEAFIKTWVEERAHPTDDEPEDYIEDFDIIPDDKNNNKENTLSGSKNVLPAFMNIPDGVEEELPFY